MKKKLPKLQSDREAERFVDNADLSEYNLSDFQPMKFEFERKSAQLNMRLPKPLLDAVKARAKTRRMPYTRFIREALEQVLDKPQPVPRNTGTRARKGTAHHAKVK